MRQRLEVIKRNCKQIGQYFLILMGLTSYWYDHKSAHFKRNLLTRLVFVAVNVAGIVFLIYENKHALRVFTLKDINPIMRYMGTSRFFFVILPPMYTFGQICLFDGKFMEIKRKLQSFELKCLGKFLRCKQIERNVAYIYLFKCVTIAFMFFITVFLYTNFFATWLPSTILYLNIIYLSKFWTFYYFHVMAKLYRLFYYIDNQIQEMAQNVQSPQGLNRKIEHHAYMEIFWIRQQHFGLCRILDELQTMFKWQIFLNRLVSFNTIGMHVYYTIFNTSKFDIGTIIIYDVADYVPSILDFYLTDNLCHLTKNCFRDLQESLSEFNGMDQQQHSRLNREFLLVHLLLGHAQSAQLKTNCFTEQCGAELMGQVNDVYWESATAYRQFSDDVLSPEILMREKLRPFYETLKKFDWKSFQDPLLKRQFEVVLRGDIYPPLNYEFKKATNTLKSMAKQKFVCNRKKPHRLQSGQCTDFAFIHQIKSKIANSDDLEEIKWYWAEWRSRMPAQIKDALHYYIHYYQNMSTPEMSASAIWYDQYEDPNFLDELEELMDAIQPFYKEMHAHLKHALRQRYGDEVIPSTGLIPHHLMEQAMYQSWKKQSVLRNPFPQRKLPNVQHELDDLEWFPFDLVNISCSFFGSMGFNNLTEDFMRDNFIEMEPAEGGPDCKSRIFTYAEIELNYCPKVYYKKLLQTHGDITHIQYAILKNNLSVGLNQEAAPGFGNAMGEAVILSASTPKHLQERLGLLTTYDYDDILNLNRLYRMAVHTVLSIPTYFVHEKLWIDMIDNKVAPENYNCHYWNLMAKYMGVGPSTETKEGSYDMPYKFYEGIVDQFRSTRKLFGEFLGYQIYRSVCLKIGEFQRGNAYKILHNCDFANHRQAGQMFKEIMSAASTKPWRQIIRNVTIKNAEKLTATAFLEYYEPLHSWTAEDNVEKSLPVGWRSVDKCNPSTAAVNENTTEVY